MALLKGTPPMTEKVVFDDLLHEEREFAPPKDFAAQANTQDESLYEKAEKDHVRFWDDMAKELHWFQPWKETMTWNPPDVKWFEGGKINITYNCLDRHLTNGSRNKAALIWEGENFERRTLTYAQLHREVCMFSE